MDDGPEWFAAKRYGYGAGLPISWQGWALILAFFAYAFAVSIAFKDNLSATAALMVPAVIGFITIVARTTRGGWRWRWGDDD